MEFQRELERLAIMYSVATQIYKSLSSFYTQLDWSSSYITNSSKVILKGKAKRELVKDFAELEKLETQIKEELSSIPYISVYINDTTGIKNHIIVKFNPNRIELFKN